ncbi:hypothetical protein SDC9_175858 [bioreactor metagenome]|uniref:Uncharacterized protein n=1 Tax=bioreactor metagenome TaxID=1076179 RepID=A0A645GNI1_9ZZZZ
MSVKVDKAQAGIFFCRRAHRAERNEMFASQQHRRFAVGEYLRGGGLYRLYRRGGVAEGQVEVSRVKYAEILKISVLIGAVGLDPEGFGAHRGGAEARARTEGGRRVKGRAEEDGARLRVGRGTADESLNVCFHLVFQLKRLFHVVGQHEGADVQVGVVVSRLQAEAVPGGGVKVFDRVEFL